MKRNTFMTIAAIIAFLFGVGYLFFPALMNESYGTPLEVAGQWVGRYMGAAYIGFGVLNWFSRNAEKSEGLRAVLLGNFIQDIIGIFVATGDSLFGGGNASVWMNVVIFLFLAIGFGYFAFRNQSD
jgi:hypothetical protein